MKITRRDFLKGTVTTLFLAGFNVPIYAYSKTKKNLIVIMMRGGMDGLCAFPIIGDKNFNKLRKDILIKSQFKLSSDFLMHPKLKNFNDLWKQNMASVVHATNIPYTKRSHFEGQNLMESGGTVPYKEKTGWLGRGMKLGKLDGDGLALALPMPLILRGVPKNDNYYPTKETLPKEKVMEVLKTIYQDSSEEELMEYMNIILNRKKSEETGMGGLKYSSRNNSVLARKASQMMSKANGPRVAVFDVGGFDTHAAQGGVEGSHTDSLVEVDKIFFNIKNSMNKNEFKNTLIVTLTEFGRTIEQNGGLGTEHGYGSAIMMGGGLLKKSQVYTDWPGLKKKELFEGRDLNSTIDARSIYASAMSAVFDLDFKRIQKEVFWGANLQNYTDKFFKS